MAMDAESADSGGSMGAVYVASCRMLLGDVIKSLRPSCSWDLPAALGWNGRRPEKSEASHGLCVDPGAPKASGSRAKP